MSLGASIFLIAVGAILAFAVNYTAQGIDINAVGIILMVVGMVGLLLSLIFWSTFVPWRRDVTHTGFDHHEPL